MINIHVLNLAELDSKTWGQYEFLWKHSFYSNPFIAPDYLKNWNKNNKNFYIAFVYKHQNIVGAIPYCFSGKKLIFANEAFADSMQLPFLTNVSITDKYIAIVNFLKEVKPKEVEFKKFCSATLDYLLFAKALKDGGYKTILANSWKNLYVKIMAPKFDANEFLKIFNKSTTRNYSNKFAREQNYKVSALTENKPDEVKKWLDVFFLSHVDRWANTSTPSIYQSNHERIKLAEKVQHWFNDKVCVLFSLDVQNEPVAMAICLTNNKSLVYHQIAYSSNPDLLKYRTNKILLFELSKWMVESGMEVLDFGVGNEPYKYEYTDIEKDIVRIYAAKGVFTTTYIKGAIDYYYQNRPKLQNILNNKIRPLIFKLKSKIRQIKVKLAANVNELKSDVFIIIKKLIRKYSPETEFFYRFKNLQAIDINDSFRISKVDFTDLLGFYENEIILSPSKIRQYVDFVKNRVRVPWGVYTAEGKLISVAWVQAAQVNEQPDASKLSTTKVIIDCFTAKSYRGKGLYPLLINNIARNHVDAEVIIYTHDWNIASQKGIEKAGFEKINTRKKIKNEYRWAND